MGLNKRTYDPLHFSDRAVDPKKALLIEAEFDKNIMLRKI